MITPPNSKNQKERLLIRFIQQVGGRSDTPSLIVTIAADTNYLWLCRAIVDPAAASDPEFAKTLKSVCRDHGLSLRHLKEKLIPAARALGLMPPSNTSADYYRLLGVRSQANAQEIKKAFHRKAVEVHPDTNANLTGSSRRFVELNDAYRTLRDPVLRRHYDVNRQHLFRWRERPGLFLPADSRPTIFLWYLSGLLIIFTILLLVLDIIVF